MLLAGIFGKKNIENLDLEIYFPEEIYAKRSAFIKIKLINKKKFFPAFLIKLIIKDLNLYHLFPYFEKEITISFPIKPEKRGINTLEEIYIASVFPFNFFTRWKKISKKFDFLVFPEPKKGKLTFYLSEKEGKEEREKDKLGLEGEIFSVKDYIEGIPAKYIHWKLTAKMDKPIMKEFSELTSKPLIIDFEEINLPDIEEKLSFITYLILEMMRKGIPVGLKIKDKFYKPDLSYKHKIALLTELALYEEPH